jgi:hypothetical protein
MNSFFLLFTLLLPLQNDNLTEKILASWAKTTLLHKEFYVHWRQFYQLGIGSYKNDKNTLAPSEPMAVVNEYKLCMQDGKFHFDADYHSLNVNKQIFNAHKISIFDGSEVLHIYDQKSLDSGVRTAAKSVMDNPYHEIRNTETMRMIHSLAPNSKHLASFNINNFTYLKNATQNNLNCVVLVKSNETSKTRNTITLCPEQNYSIIHQIITENDIVKSVWSANYQQIEKAWVISNFELSEFRPNNSLLRKVNAELISYRSGDCQCDFRLEVPIKTVVTDTTVTSHQNYAIDAKGEKIQGDNYSKLIAAASVQRKMSNGSYIYMLVVICIFSIIYYIVRKRLVSITKG